MKTVWIAGEILCLAGFATGAAWQQHIAQFHASSPTMLKWVTVARSRWPGLDQWQDREIEESLKKQTSFRSAFKECAKLNDAEIDALIDSSPVIRVQSGAKFGAVEKCDADGHALTLFSDAIHESSSIHEPGALHPIDVPRVATTLPEYQIPEYWRSAAVSLHIK